MEELIANMFGDEFSVQVSLIVYEQNTYLQSKSTCIKISIETKSYSCYLSYKSQNFHDRSLGL